MKARVTKSWMVTNSGKPELRIVASGGEVEMRWECGCGTRALREDFASSRLVCPRCGATLPLVDALSMVRQAKEQLEEMERLIDEQLPTADPEDSKAEPETGEEEAPKQSRSRKKSES